jgi:hypothetical protein
MKVNQAAKLPWLTRGMARTGVCSLYAEAAAQVVAASRVHPSSEEVWTRGVLGTEDVASPTVMHAYEVEDGEAHPSGMRPGWAARPYVFRPT